MRRGTMPTMKDVAQEAGVALGTVSKVFNDIPVGEDYRRRVLDAARKLGYQVNSYARGLKAGKTGTVALILPNAYDPYFAALADSVCQALARRGCRMLMAVTGSDPDAEQQCIRMVEQNKVDGIIGLTYNPALEIPASIPFVSIDRYFNPAVPCVASDNFGGGQLAAEKLAELGCRRLLFLRIGADVPGEPDKRMGGFQAACQARGLEHAVMALNDRDGYEPFRVFLRSHVEGGRLSYDGIFCNTDRLAFYVQNMLAELGLRVPEDVQVVGFDGVRRFGNDGYYCSTIVQPVGQLAETSVSILLEEDRSALPSLICLPVSYAPGGTTMDG